MRNKQIYILGLMLLLSGTLFAQVHIGGNVYGGCELGKVSQDAEVNFNGGTIDGSLYGGGMGAATDEQAGCVRGNTTVTMTGGTVISSIYGGGQMGSVGTFTTTPFTYTEGTHAGQTVNLPTSCADNTGSATVTISGGTVGRSDRALMPHTLETADDIFGYVFCGSEGEGDSITYPKAIACGVVGNTHLTISGTSTLITASVYGGCENGLVLDNTHVEILSGQIGLGHYATEAEGVVTHHYDGIYSEAQWTAAKTAVQNSTVYTTYVNNPFHECDHWPYRSPYAVYDIYANNYTSNGGSTTATNGHSFFGNVFGGGSGYYPIAPGVWRRTAGQVNGNTLVEIKGGHILTSIYGGNEYTDVKGKCTVEMTGGTLGVPRSLDSIVAHPVTCYLFGAGMGDEREAFNTFTTVGSVEVTVTDDAFIFGSVFGGGEDGHVLGDVAVNIQRGTAYTVGSETRYYPIIGTTGTSYVDGNVFGGGRGFSGRAKTAGVVQGNIHVNITGGTMLGSVYGGGRLASVGTYLVDASDEHYGKMREDVPDDPNTTDVDETKTYGHIKVDISGGLIGNPYEYVYPTDAQRNTTTGSLRFTLFHSTSSGDGANQLMHTKGGNVFGGSMGRIVAVDGTTVNPYWPTLGRANYSTVNISGGTIKSCVFGGGEMGSMANNTTVNITGGTIGTTIPQTASASGHTGGNEYSFGYVYGGGYGSLSTDATANDSTGRSGGAATPAVLAGRVFGNTEVNITAGTIRSEVYGGGEMASVGHEATTTRGNTLVNIGSSTISGDDYTGSALIVGRNVYGANNIIGTPYGNTEVHIYKLARTSAQEVAGDQYSLDNVYGGGHMANYAPSTASSHRASVHVHGCKNTIEDVFGGGDAADAYGAGVTIDGGRFDRVFGGGNGEVTAANIGAGGTLTEINGGIIRLLFGGSNEQGSISGPLRTLVTNSGSCTEQITEFYAGSNLADIVGDLNTTIACNATDPVAISKIYGGCKLADIYGSVTLTVEGGTFTEVYGGSRGETPAANASAAAIAAASADIKAFDATHHPAGGTVGEGGNVTLNLYGGTMVDAFGGNDLFGNVEGVVTVNVNDQGTCPLVITHNVYGGGNLATCKANDATTPSPIVNLIKGTVGNDVFGGGKGDLVTYKSDKGVATHPYVHMTGVPSFQVGNNIYGGGELSIVTHDARVQIGGGTVGGSVYGGGKGITASASGLDTAFALARVKGNTQVDVSGGKVTYSVYGGGEMASVGTITDSTEKHTNELSSFALSWPYKFVYAANTGTSTVNITGGRIGVTGKDYMGPRNNNGDPIDEHGNLLTSQQIKDARVDNGDVYGGGKGLVADRYIEAHYANVNNTVVTVNISSAATPANYKENGLDGYACIAGALYGGGENGHVNTNTSVTLDNGLVGHAVYGGGKGKDTYKATLKKRPPNETVDSVATIYSLTAGKVYGNTNINMTGGTVVRSLYGGGNLASVGKGNYACDASDYNQTSNGYGEKVSAYTVGTSTDTTNTGRTYVTITGGTLGCLTPSDPSESVKDNIPYGSVFGGCRGSATRDVPRTLTPRFRYCPEDYLGYVNKTYVTIGDGTNSPRIYGSVYGGGQDGHVRWTTYVRVRSGEIGVPYISPAAATALVGTSDFNDVNWLHRGNVYGGGSGIGTVKVNDQDVYSYISGSVTHFTRTDIEGGTIHRNVYGGGSLATVGPPKIGQPDEAAKSLTLAQVNISGGTVGSLADASGSYVVHHDAVEESGTPGEPGYVAPVAAYDETVYFSYGGNVYGGSRGQIDVDNATFSTVNYTEVNVTDGRVYASVYGGGEIGTIKKDADVNISGGTIGDASQYNHGDADPTHSAAIAAYYNDNLPDHLNVGHVYGGGKGISADVAGTYKTYCNVVNTNVDVSGTAQIHGSVYGGAADGHVTGTTDVTVSGGTVGTLGLSAWDGHVFGGGQGSGTVTGNVDEEEFTLCATCGNVGGNTNVTMSAGALKGSIYGGGRLALTGVDVNGDYYTFATADDSTLHGFATVAVSGGTIGSSDGVALEASDWSLGDIFGSGRGDVEWYQSVLAGRVANTSVTVSGTPTVYGAVFGGGEMAGIGWWSDAAGHPFEPYTGTSTVTVSGGTIGTPYEFTAGYLANAGDWTVITPDGQGGGRLTHSCTGNIVGGSQGDVDLSCPAWISMGRSRQTYVDISGTPVIMGNVYGGAEQGVVTENTHVKVRGGTIGTLIPEFTVDEDGDPATTTDRTTYKSHYFGSVFGGGYGSERWWDTVHVYNDNGVFLRADQVYNDSCLFSSTDHSQATMTHYTAATQIAGRVYGNTYVDITGGTIHENVYGGGNMASVGYVEKDASGDEQLLDSTKWHGGVCNVTIGGNAVIGPLDGTELNACVYGAGKGVGNDPDDPTTAANEENFLRYCNVTSTNLIVKGGFIDGSTFGGGADCHVLRHTNTTVCNTVADAAYHQAHDDVAVGTLLAIPIIGSGQIVDISVDPDGYSGYEQEYDGCVIGGGRNALNANHTAGRVQGHTRVTVTGGRIKRSVIGGGALARTGVDVNGLVTSFTSGIVYDSLHHGSTFVDVSGDTLRVRAADFNSVTINGKTYKEIFSGTTVPKGGDSIVYLTTIGAPNGPILVDNDYTIGDIFGGGKGDTKDTVDFMAGRVMNTHVKVSGSPRIMADVYAGAEMASVGWWDTNRYVGDYGTSAENSNHDVYYTNTGYSKVTIKDNPNTGTPYEFSTDNYIDNRKAWTLVDGVGRLTHTCSGNVYGGGQGYVEEKATHRWNWVHMGRVRYTTVSISGGRFMGNVFGGGSRGVVKEDCNVTITGGRIGCVIHDESKDSDDNTKNKYVNQQYYYGSVFGGGYGNPKTFIHWNDSCFVATNGDSVKMIPTEQAGRVYGNTFVNISGGHIYDCVYGGGDMASTGYVERDLATGRYLFEDATKRHGGVCTVNITGTTIIGPLDGNGLNAYVYGSGKGVGYDPDETYKLCANVNEAHLTVSLTFTATPDSTLTDYGWNSATDGRIYGSLFGGGADCHVLGDVYTTLHSGLIGTAGTTSWDGNIFGAGRNYLNTNHTNGRVQGNVEVLMDGGILMGSLFGGGRMALTGIDVDGHFPTSSWDPTEHGNVDIQVRGNAIIGTHVSSDLLGAYESCGDIFGGGKGDCDPYKDIWAGRVSNVTITVKDDASGNSPRIHGGVFGGGEMASLGYWDDTIKNASGTVIFHTSSSDLTTPGTTYGTHYGTFYTGTGSATISITGGVVIGTFDELALYTKPTHENQAQRVYATAPYENPGEWTIYNADGTVLHTCTGNVYGGCQGDIDVTKPRWVSMGRSRTSEVTIGGGTDNPKIMGCVFGGAEQGIMTGDASVTINSGTIGTHVTTGSGATTNYIYGDVYGAGYGCDDASEWGVDDYQSTIEPHNDSTAGSQALHIGWNPGLLAGRTFGNATVDILGGHILGSVYGGGSFASLGDDKSTGYGASTSLYPVNGISTVNIGSRTAGNATIDGDVFGANNYKGTPYGGTHVNIYHTAHSGNNSYPDTVALKALAEPTNALTGADLAKQYEENTTMPQTFALRAVYGGGNKAAHTPIADDSASVHVWFCSENTIKDVYGGGNAAATKNNHVVIDGGRINRVFGGGNGYSATGNHDTPLLSDNVTPDPNYNPGADVSGTAHTEIKGGIIDSVWGGSNQLGIILNTVLDVTHEDASCPEVINQTTGGGNESPGGGGTVTVRCGAYQENFYAGGSFADVGSPSEPATITLNVEGGHITNLYAGCQGDKASYGTGHSDRPANIYGDVILNFYGGNVVNLFGGSHRNGNITGTITVNVDVDPDYTCTDGLRLDHVYGAGQEAAYTPTDPFRLSPTVNIMNNRVYRSGTSGTMADSAWVEIMDVFGGGLGTTATCTSYPCVVVGGFGNNSKVINAGTAQEATVNYTRGARIFGNVYGGGSAAPVIGNTIVMVRDATVGRDDPDPTLSTGVVFGGGYGPTAKVTGETYVGIFGLSDIKNNVYGGGNAGIVTGSTEIQIGYQKQIFPAEIVGFDDNGTIKGRFQCATPGVKFSFTTDGSVPPVPATESTLWDGTTPFLLTWDNTIQCVTYLWDETHNKVDSSMIPSFVAFDKAPAPSISIEGNSVTFDGPVGARIRYTLDGSEPNGSSTSYGIIGEGDAETPINITSGGTQVVKAFIEMRGCYNSDVTALTADKPVITFDETDNEFKITAKAGDRIIYTTDLSTPTSTMSGTPTDPVAEHGTKVTYNGTPIPVSVSASEDTTIKAIVERTGCLPSLIEAKVHRVP